MSDNYLLDAVQKLTRPSDALLCITHYIDGVAACVRRDIHFADCPRGTCEGCVAKEAVNAAAFNDAVPVGTPVTFWPGLRFIPGRDSVTRTPAWATPSGDALVSVEGYPGGIALSHVAVRHPQGQEEEHE